MAKDSQDMLSMPVRDFVQAVAAKTPTPGGGSVGGVVGALSAALAEMALVFTSGKKKYAAYQQYYDRLAPRLAKARGMFQDLVADDVAAYGLYRQAMDKPDGAEKDQAVQLALAAAIDVPREGTKLALAVLADLAEFAGKCNPYLISDLVAAGALAVAAVSLADYNVRVNVPQVADRAAAEEIRRASAADLNRAKALLAEIERAAAPHMP